MSKKILFIPLDERPCNYELPYLLSRIAKGYSLLRPSKDILGDMKKPSSYKKLRKFMADNAERSDIAIISLDQLLYGGIVPSRIHHLPIDELKKRLSTIKELKKINPDLKIYLFSLILRCPCYSTSEEEPDYYGECGGEIFEYGVLYSKRELGLIDNEEFISRSGPLLNKIGPNIDDFLLRRKTNRDILESFIREYSQYVECFVIPQDDSEPFGFAMLDRKYIAEVLDQEGVKANMYPGADEVGMVLLARSISDDMGIHPSVRAVYPKKECMDMTPMYEAQPVHKTLLAQLDTIGFEYEENSDNIVYMNYPTKKSVNMGSPINESYLERDMDSFIDRIVSSVKNGKKAILVDGAFCNGGEEAFLLPISQQVSLYSLYGYGGWNTSSNAMGSSLADAMLTIIFGLNEGHARFISERVVEDIGYCGHVRWDVWHNYAPEHGYSLEDAGCRNGIVAKEIKRQLNEYVEEKFPEINNRYDIAKCQLPWRRLFEVDLKLKERKVK